MKWDCRLLDSRHSSRNFHILLYQLNEKISLSAAAVISQWRAANLKKLYIMALADRTDCWNEDWYFNPMGRICFGTFMPSGGGKLERPEDRTGAVSPRQALFLHHWYLMIVAAERRSPREIAVDLQLQVWKRKIPTPVGTSRLKNTLERIYQRISMEHIYFGISKYEDSSILDRGLYSRVLQTLDGKLRVWGNHAWWYELIARRSRSETAITPHWQARTCCIWYSLADWIIPWDRIVVFTQWKHRPFDVCDWCH